jgi:hypothetical protein
MSSSRIQGCESYLWKKSYAFKALCLEYRHNRLNNGGMVVIERMVLQYRKEGCDDDSLKVVIRSRRRSMLRYWDFVHRSHRGLVCFLFWLDLNYYTNK